MDGRVKPGHDELYNAEFAGRCWRDVFCQI